MCLIKYFLWSLVPRWCNSVSIALNRIRKKGHLMSLVYIFDWCRCYSRILSDWLNTINMVSYWLKMGLPISKTRYSGYLRETLSLIWLMGHINSITIKSYFQAIYNYRAYTLHIYIIHTCYSWVGYHLVIRKNFEWRNRQMLIND